LDYQVVWRGPVQDMSGYGTASRGYVLALDRQGVDVKVEMYTQRGFPYTGRGRPGRESGRLSALIGKRYAVNKPKVLIWHGSPWLIDARNLKDTFDRIILNTVWETNRIPRAWVPVIRQFDCVCIPSMMNESAVRSSGVAVPVFVVPHGVDTHLFRPDNEKLRIHETDGKFVFVSVFDFQHRKNPETLLRAYWEQFQKHDNAVLVIKTFPGTRKRPGVMPEAAIQEYKKRLGFGNGTAPLVVLPRRLDERMYRGLHALGDAFVLPTRGEGVGLPFLEALASGVPVIATRWGGQTDFANDRNSFLVDYRLEEPMRSMGSKHAIAPLYRGLFDSRDQLWAEADIHDLRRKMKQAFDNPELCRQKGRQGRADMALWSWDRAGETWKRVVEQVLG